MASFRPGRGPTVLTFAAALVFASLGVWQVTRHVSRSRDLAEKSARSELPPEPFASALADPRAHAFRRAVLRGRFELADTVLVGPVEREHALGARVLTPLHREGDADDAPRVLVDRGWIPQDATPEFLPPADGSSDVVLVTGLALELATRDAARGSRAARQTHFPRFHPDRPGLVAKLAAQLPYDLLPVMLQSAAPEPPRGLPIGEPARPVSPVDHRGYAIQWFAIAALSVAAWVEYGRRRAREG